MSYKILLLYPRLYYVKWFNIPKPNEPLMKQYFFELNAILDSEEEAVFFVSDLREGHITNAHLFIQLIKVLDHKNYGGGCSFGDTAMVQADVSMFNYMQKMSRGRASKQSNEMFASPEEAIIYIEKRFPDISSTVDWDEVISGRIF
jgi:hypothetical protein